MTERDPKDEIDVLRHFMSAAAADRSASLIVAVVADRGDRTETEVGRVYGSLPPVEPLVAVAALLLDHAAGLSGDCPADLRRLRGALEALGWRGGEVAGAGALPQRLPS